MSKYEKTDPVPLILHTGIKTMEGTHETIGRVLSQMLSERARDEEQETLEESEDFEIEDNFDKIDPLTKYELQTMIEDHIQQPEADSEEEVITTTSSSEPRSPEAKQQPERQQNTEEKPV